MMKKVLYGVALALLACGPVCTLQSCKDDVSDLKTQTDFNLSALQEALDARAKDLQYQIDLNKAKINKNENDINELMRLSRTHATYDYVNTRVTMLLNALKNQYDYFNGQLDAANGNILLNQQEINKLKAEDQKILAQIAGALDRIGSLEDNVSYLSNHLDALRTIVFSNEVRISKLEGRVEATEAAIEEMKKTLADVQDDVKDLQDQIDIINRNLNTLGSTVEQLKADVYYLREDLNALTVRVENLETRMTAVENALDLLTNRMDNLITNILIQRAVSPVFGDLSLPIGIKSNILFNWYGYNDIGEGYNFPNAGSEYDPNKVGAGVEFATPKNGYAQIGAGYFADQVYLGDVYVTLNPIGANFNGTPLSFTTSLNNKLDCKVVLEETDYELKHGYTRGETLNGEVANNLYVAHIYVASRSGEDGDKELKQVVVNIDDKLRDAMEDIVTTPNKRNAASLVKAVYDQLNGICPAYALRYDWTSINKAETPATKSNSVLSGFDLAVATARPLGFNFLEGKGSSKKYNTISNLDNFISEFIEKNVKLDIKGENIEVGGKKIGFATVKDGNGNVTFTEIEDEGLIATIKGLTIDGVEVPAFTTTESGYDPFEPDEATEVVTEAIKDKVLAAFGGKDNASEDIKAQVNIKIDLVLLQMSQQINEVVANINGQIDKTLENVGENGDSYLNKVNRAVELYNKVINKINNFLKDPNHYLQAAAFYDTKSNMGILSGDVKHPTTFKAAGGNAFNVFLSSYNAELVVPAFKKYVAITGVYDLDGKKLENENVSALNDGDLNKVLEGKDIRVIVPVSKLQKNDKVYEFTYQAVDYRGFTSTYKFYVKVVDK